MPFVTPQNRDHLISAIQEGLSLGDAAAGVLITIEDALADLHRAAAADVKTAA